MKFRAFLILSMLFAAPGLEAAQFRLNRLFEQPAKKNDFKYNPGSAVLIGVFTLGASWMLFKGIRWVWIQCKPEQELYDDALKVYTDIMQDFENELKLSDGLENASDFDYLMRCQRIERIVGGRYPDRVRYPLIKFVEDVEKKNKQLDWQVQILEAKFGRCELGGRGLSSDVAQLLEEIQALKQHLTLLKNTIKSTALYKFECAERSREYDAFNARLRAINNNNIHTYH